MTRGSAPGAARSGPYSRQVVEVPDGYLAVGQIVGAHGLRGEIKVDPHTDNPLRFAAGSILYMGPELEKVVVAGSRSHKNHQLVCMTGIQHRGQAESLRGLWLFVPEEDAIPLDEDTFWIHDIIGLTVQTQDGRLLGSIVDIIQTGANDVYIVRAAPSVNRGKDILLPAIAQVVLEVDLAAGTMTVSLQPGLLEEDA